jgi:hypothetical protein
MRAEITRGPAVQKGARGPIMLQYVWVFLGIIVCNSAMTDRVHGSCGQRPSFVRCFLLCFLPVPPGKPYQLPPFYVTA